MEESITVKDLTAAEPLALAQEIIHILDAKKASGIKLLHVADKTVIADYFVICQGNSNTQVEGLCDEVDYRIGLDGVSPTRTEGHDSASWILMDYSSVLVHIFQNEARKFYNLEKLWADAEEIDISSLLIDETPKDPA